MMAAILVAIVVFAVITLPRAPIVVTGADPSLVTRTVRGAFHVHTNRSDGFGDKAAVARAAHRAGLNFVILTDHGDGTRAPDPPAYVDGVLCLEAVEVSTDEGHYIALGAAPSAYPLGGAASAVVEDVARLGGFGVAAHPSSSRGELAWGDWSAAIDALEWLNADSEWRDETRWQMSRSLLAYPIRPAGALAALLDRPDSALSRWDGLASQRRVLAIAGHDAHGGIGQRLEDPSPRRSVGVPSYEASFRTFSTVVEMAAPLAGDAARDGGALIERIRSGRFYTEIDAVATGATLEFDGRTAAESVGQGSVLDGEGVATFTARASVPRGSTMVGFRNGSAIARSTTGSLEFQSAEMGAYRVEVQVEGAPGNPPVPWLVSNPVFRLMPAAPKRPSIYTGLRSWGAGSWRIEKDDGSYATVRPGGGPGEVEFEYRLREGGRASQYVALVVDLARELPEFDAVRFAARSAAPRRISVQLRFAADAGARWGKSVYTEPALRGITVDVDTLRRADGPPTRPPSRRATSLLFVVDLTNAKPGESGTIFLTNISLARRSVEP